MHFKQLLEKNTGDNDNLVWEEGGGEENNLCRPITKEEVVLALRKLKNRKAAGPDGIIGELSKYACRNELVLSFYVIFFQLLV